jgi:hypothetical protein
MYQLYVIDAHGRSEVVLDTHNSNGNRAWLLPDNRAITIVLDHNGFRTYLELDVNGDLIVEQDDISPPKPKPKRRSRFRRQYR